ncbi:family 43 glycosylhydrolase [Gracilibacillus massiliensis]|uniref:family 43 glycosylhydrolase n=1 Tax=Gracilibacillus massiliensis TaxID=1564956 RepID=UPI00071DA116|nr:family 43 glycosylhydrolase [Gracilibacillus massiliensis]
MLGKKYLALFMVFLMFLSLFPVPATVKANNHSATELIAHYDMTNLENQLIDKTNNGNDATIIGFESEDFKEEDNHSILDFTGDKDKYIELPQGLIDDETFTIETTFSTSTAANHWLYTLGTIEAEWPNVNNYIFLNPKQGNDSIRFGIKDAEDELLFQDASIASGEYQTVTATFEDELITIYINGELAGELPHTYSVQEILENGVEAGSDIIGYIGKSLYTPDPAFTGKLADFKVYNETLTAAEVKHIYLSSTDQLIAHYDMSQEEGNLVDVTNNGNDAPVVGFDQADFTAENDNTILNFTGDKSEYVKLPKGLITDETFTIETTFSTSTAANHWLYTLGTMEAEWPNVNNYVFFNPKQGNDTVRFGIKDAESEELFQEASIESGEYQTVTATFEDELITIYINGEEVGNLPHTFSVMDILANGVDVEADFIGYIGKSLYTPDPAFTGKLADFKVYNYTLTAEEIKEMAGLTDQEIVDKAKSELVIPNASDIRGNITLPSSSAEGASITWETDNADVISVTKGINESYDNIPPGVVTRQATDTIVTLTATISYGDIVETKELEVTVKAAAEIEDYQAYLMTHFTGEHDIGEQIYFANSEDGFHWEDLNDGDPVLTSDIGEKGVRDPYIIRSPEGDRFYLIATDLRIASGKGWGQASTNGSKSLIIWESSDLVNWSEARMVEVAPSNAGNAWAPEAVYDEETGEYIVFWASTTRNENGEYSEADIYYAKTRDFYSFTEPEIYIDRPGDQHIIDTTIIKDHDMYYRYSADGQITIEQSQQILGDWSEVGNLEPLGLTNDDVEGPLIFKMNDEDKWNLMVDQYATGQGYLPLLTTDLSSGDFTRVEANDYSLGSNRKRHGSVLPITMEEYQAIQEKWNQESEIPDEEEQQAPVLSYSFEESMDEGVIQDNSGNERDGKLYGNATYQHDQEKDSQVLYLDGTDNTFAGFPTGFFDGRDTVTISMDIKPETVTGNFFTFALGKDNQRYMFLRTRDTEIRNAITSNSWSNEQEVKANTASVKDKWMTVDLVVTPTSMKMYKDGILLAENNNITVSMSDLGNDLFAYLGKSFYPEDPYFSGAFDNVEVYNRALSTDEILDKSLSSTGIAAFQLPGQKGVTEIDAVNHQITVPFKGKEVDLSNLTPEIVIASDAEISPTADQAQDFTEPIRYTVTDKDGNQQEWTVEVEIYPSATLPGLYADPQIFVHDDTFYLYPTTDGFEGWSGTQFKAFSSKDLINWEDHGVILDLATDDVEWATGNAWAPGFAEKDGKFYHYFSANQQIGVASSSSPTEGFEDALGEPLIPRDEYSGQAIDPYVFTDDDGKSYFYWGNGSLWGAELNEDMISLAEEPVNMTPDNFREGVVVFKRDDKYYLMWSENDTRDENYQVAYAIGDTPMGPWTKQDVILNKDLAQGIKATGHHSVLNIPDTDDYYIVYHRFSIPDGNGFNREVMIDKMEFNQDGTIKDVVPTLEGITEPVYIDKVGTDPDEDDETPEEDLELDFHEKQEVTAATTYIISGTNAQITTPSDLPEGTTIIVEPMDIEGTNYEGLKIAGEAFNITVEYPEGASEPANDFILSLGYQADANPDEIAVYYYNEEKDEWEHRGGEVDLEHQTIQIAVSHFSSYGVFAEIEDDTTDPDNNGDGNNGSNDDEDQDSDDDNNNSNDQDDTDDNNEIPSGNQQTNGKEGEKQSGDELPNTATSIYNYLLISLILLAFGTLLLAGRRLKK